jgi:ribonucleotide monophosphatase NagD (HAD superfamily)
VLFATNNSWPTVSELVARLEGCDIPAVPADLVTSAGAAVGLVEPGTPTLLLAGPGVREQALARGLDLRGAREPEVVIVGWTDQFDFAALARASAAVRSGARFVATNEDPTLPTPDGPVPGCGALVAAVATASGRSPEVAGKPHPPLARLVAAEAGRPAIVVGDRATTDGALARALGVPFGLVLTGVTGPDGPAAERRAAAGAVEAPDLATLVERALSGEVLADS